MKLTPDNGAGTKGGPPERIETTPVPSRMTFPEALTKLQNYRGIDTTHITSQEDIAREFADFIEAAQVATLGLLLLLPGTTVEEQKGAAFENKWTNLAGKQINLSISYRAKDSDTITNPYELLAHYSGSVIMDFEDPTKDLTKRVFQEYFTINPGTTQRNSWVMYFFRTTMNLNESLSYDPSEVGQELDYTYAPEALAVISGEVDVAKPNPWSRLADYIVLFSSAILERLEDVDAIEESGSQTTIDGSLRRLPPRNQN